MTHILKDMEEFGPFRHPPAPTDFVDRTCRTFGDAGRRWLSTLPATLAHLVRLWDLKLEEPYEELSFQYVVRARRGDGSPVVLKLGVPRDELDGEVQALRAYAGRGVVRLLESDHSLGALLLERIEPGFQLAELARRDDIAATEIGAGVVRRLMTLGVKPNEACRRSISRGFVETDWAQAFDGYRTLAGRGAGPLPADVVREAELRFERLLASVAVGDQIMLHGDLHHHNILKSSLETDAWVVIDPKGVIGEPACELSAFVRNPGSVFAGNDDPEGLMYRRVEALASATDLDPLRIRDWGIVGSVVSAIWCVEDSEPEPDPTVWKLAIDCARWLSCLRFK